MSLMWLAEPKELPTLVLGETEFVTLYNPYFNHVGHEPFHNKSFGRKL
jgi:hypothetical protein